MQSTQLFSESYAEARSKFLAAAGDAGLDVDSQPHPLRGRDGETLALDSARYGPATAASLLIVSSGCHGIEGFCGSAVQLMLLGDTAFRQSCRDANVSVLYLHALNPYGFSWWRRTTHENVDLNRNFHDFDRPLPVNPGYDELADWLVPAEWPPTPEVQTALADFIATHGMPALQAAVSGGQYKHPDGLFFGGTTASWSNLRLRDVLRRHAKQAKRLAWIDVHTGLGPTGVGERISAAGDDPATLARARRWWGAAVTSIVEGSSSSAKLAGLMWHSVEEECSQAEYTGIALEFGTVPLLQVMEALRADQWLQNHPDTPSQQALAIKQQLREAFYIDTNEWKQQVLVQAAEAARQAVSGLTGAEKPAQLDDTPARQN